MIALIGKKLGMTQVFNNRGELIPATIVGISHNYVLEVCQKTESLPTVCLASNHIKQQRLSKAQQGVYILKNIPFQRDIMEFKCFSVRCKIGDVLDASIFNDVEYIDVVGWSKGRGYQGVIKRYNFGGGRASHGSKFHREVGSTGMAAYPSKTLKNTKMAGRMPVKRVTTQNLRILFIDNNKNVIVVKGAIPGPSGRKVVVKNATKRMSDF